ncbi:DUF4214 domain-containing protein [Sulfitobacter sp. M57]|uniref:DUF4214 domain-containing protein n=2 Tax=unclassified Sulfitobacter TaxID=196795 RepID=UPI0023E1280F|nr:MULTISPECIES: DUF4214 domain-containing protein [unclassified Sulfitobacter]MDF3464599.1 DUF4214 domain-containing protein [Sulfitobacter sp. Ks18]MDF3511199.1 DUF4214 domain-containing protein [Sulfitobacter sp. M57]MDF3515146.1 DUF4214 domain-containing protein [Sulfitobacter sp. M36]MDF3522947.1 DUF4214 domain-containing protein [Sulfitobacter sp. M74]MDF3542511.1 DUF4214 domain-containing protein [Sulfitobacter sp. M62]
MADDSGWNDNPLFGTELGALSFDEVTRAPSTSTSFSVVDSVGLYDSISASGYRTGTDFNDFFTFSPSGLDTVRVSFDNISSGTYANTLWISPLSGVSKVTGDFVSTSYGGEHAYSSTRYTRAVDTVSEGLLDLIDTISPTADMSDATWHRGERGDASAIWTLNGDPVVFEVSGFQFSGDDFQGSPSSTVEIDEVTYRFEFEPHGRAFGNAGPGSLFFVDTFGESQTHTGGDAIDIYKFAGSLGHLLVDVVSDNELSVSHRREGSTPDTLLNIERIEMNNGYLAFDTDGNAGQMYRLYQAAFDRAPDHEGLGHWINTYDNEVFDLVGVAEEFLMSEEFRTRFGTEETLDDSAFLTLLYSNVLDRTPDQAGFDFWSAQQADGISRADMLQYFSESTENYANVAGEIDAGIYYIM